MKRSYILALCIALCMTMTLATTISYLSDVDSDVNIMTLGNVKIDLMEFERMGEGELSDFHQFKEIYPLVGELGDVDGFGLPTNENFIDKMVLVESHARNANAYLRVYIGVPSALRNIDVGNGETIDAVHLYMGEDVTIDYGTPMYEGAWPWHADPDHDRKIEIDGVPYDMLCFNYTKLLTPDEVTPVLLGGVYMNPRVDNGDYGGYTIWHNGIEHPLEIDLENGVQIPVYVQAIQAAGFSDRDQAFEESGMNDTPFDLHLIGVPDQPDGPDYPDDGSDNVGAYTAMEALEHVARGVEGGKFMRIGLWEDVYDFADEKVAAFANAMNKAGLPPEPYQELVVEGGRTIEINMGGTMMPEAARLVVNDGSTLILTADEFID